MSDEYQRIYHVGLLDDLHNYFPSLLYRPQLFRNVEDVLHYIQQRTAARFNLFEMGRNQFLNSESRSMTDRFVRPRTIIPEPMVDTNIQVEVDLDNPLSTALDTFLRNLIVQEAPAVSPIRFGGRNGRGGLRGMGVRGATPFQDVIVHATQAQIDAASCVYPAEAQYVERGEVCTICQDRIQLGEEVRHLNACRHDYHRACIDTWLLRRSVLCPTCRHDIRDLNGPPSARPSPQITGAPGPQGGQEGPQGGSQGGQTGPPPNPLPPSANDVLRMLNFLAGGGQSTG
jgi:hypothetical protein